MHLYDPGFLFAFLPVFIGLYAILPAKKRPAAIALANLLMLFTVNKYGLLAYIAGLVSVYISGISIFNNRKIPEKAESRKKILRMNIIGCAGFFIFFSVSGKGSTEDLLLSPASVYCWGVIPLHLISYLTDVYRGDCEAQTSFLSLAAYTGFFPCASFGPVMKYKCFENSFKAPKLSLKKLATGIRLYVFGLAEYLIIAKRLEAIRNEIISAPDSLRGGTGWLYVLLFYIIFMVSIQGLLHMGQGVAMMLGFYIRPSARRKFFTEDLIIRLRQMNEPLAAWVRDYIYKPIFGYAGKESSAFTCAVCAGAMWYSFSAGWLLTGFAFVGLIALQKELYKDHVTFNKTSKSVITRLFVLFASVVCAFFELPSASLKIFGSKSGSENAFIEHIITETAVPFACGLFMISAFLPELIRRINYVWLKALIPVIEIFLLVVSVSFMLNMV